jgi:dihydrodipicolinate synthase/N-acetylneuraminate lyase
LSRVKGLIVPLLTPLNEDLSIDKIALKSHVAKLMNKGVKNFLILSSFGEREYLSEDQEKELIKLTSKEVEGKANLLIGCFSQSTDTIISKIRFASKYSNKCVINVPYHALTSEVEFVSFFDSVFRETRSFVYLYNDPVEFKRNIPVIGLNRIANWEQFLGVFDFSKNMVYFKAISEYKQSFKSFQGIEELAIESFNYNAEGLVVGVSNIIPELFTRLKDDFELNGYNFLVRNELNILTIMKDYFPEKRIQSYKKILEFEGIIRDYYSKELPKLSEADESRINMFIDKAFSRINK